MNTKKQAEAIATALGAVRKPCTCGFDKCPLDNRWHWPNTDITDDLPDYLNDLNAMYDAEELLPRHRWPDYCSVLEWVMGVDRKSTAYKKSKVIHATAAQRAEAFLRTLDLWE